MVALTTFISIGISLAISIVLTVAKMLLFPAQKPQQQAAVPKPADGKYNFKQNVPSLARVYGRVKKPGDYFFLEERLGSAFHGTVIASHRIEGYVQHYLHDEPVTFVGGDDFAGITAPAHFLNYVVKLQRSGLPLETSYNFSSFSDIWGDDHRGDGLASVVMVYFTAPADNYAKIFPQQSPIHSVVVDGAWLYDPRTNQDPDDPETWSFSTNIPLMRLDHYTHISGGRLTKADMYLPDWEVAADVADEVVLNREDEEEPRYHGGMWYRYDNDQVEIGRLLDEAAEMVVYERADGKVGVHPGVMVTPDVRITKKDMHAFHYDANRRVSTNVLAVRGRFTDPDAVYNTVDAATYGDPYTGDDTQRTKTVDNQVVQYHNHIQRMQKLAFTRANAERVSITIDFDITGPSREIRYRRFVRVHYPERGLDEAIVEIIGRPRLSLANLTYKFDGIVVPATLYSFDAATEEGVPGNHGEAVDPAGVPPPDNFAIGINSEVVVGHLPQAVGVASWDHISDALTYELEYQLDDESEPPASVFSKPGETEVKTPALQDGFLYRFRLRTQSNGAVSDWTSYETDTAVADPISTAQPDSFNTTKVGTTVTATWNNPNSPNLYRTVLYRGTTASFGAALPIYTANGGIDEPRSYPDTALAVGTYYWWVESFNASGVGSGEVGPESETIP